MLSLLFAVGEAQNEPNRDPYLPDPQRNPPPWAIGSRSLEWVAKRKGLVIVLLALVVILPIVIPLLIPALKNAIV